MKSEATASGKSSQSHLPCGSSRTSNFVKLAGSLLLLSALFALAFVTAVLATPQRSTTSGAVSDETLIVTLAPHADREKVKAELLKEAQATTIRDMHVDREDYSIFVVQPPKGQSDATLKKIEAMIKTHKEIVSVSRNYTAHSPLVPRERLSGNGRPGADGDK
jgi:hypothetical protein